MYKEKTDIITGENGEIRGVDHSINTSNLSQRQFAQMLRNMPKQKRNGFLKECKIVGIMPMYLPDGDFSPDKHALNLDQDQVDWFFKRRKSFAVED